jgi:sec-independent protein translocase protein TatA
MISGNEWIIVIIVVALIFGASRLPLLGRNLGQGIREFRKGVSEARSDRKANKGEQAAPPADQPSPPADRRD